MFYICDSTGRRLGSCPALANDCYGRFATLYRLAAARGYTVRYAE
jgi:hypothetical protein